MASPAIVGDPSVKIGGGLLNNSRLNSLRRWNEIVACLESQSVIAPVVYTDGEDDKNVDVNNVALELGTPAAPQLTIIKDAEDLLEGDDDYNGGVTGAGILIIEGEAEFEGNFDFEGLVIIIGDEIEFGDDDSDDNGTGTSGTQQTITGGLVALAESEEPGELGEIEIEWESEDDVVGGVGTTQIRYSEAAVNSDFTKKLWHECLNNPVVMTTWREVE